MKILVVLSRFPYPLDKGDKLRAFHQIRELSKEHSISLVALSDEAVSNESVERLKEYCDSIHIFRLPYLAIFWNVLVAMFNGKPIQVGYFYRRSIHKKIQDIIRTEKPDHVFGQLVRVASYIKDFEGGSTLDFQDALSMGMKRRADKAGKINRIFFHTEYKRLRRYEEQMLEQFRHCTIISHPDRMLIRNPSQKDIHVVTNGVDFDFFTPQTQEKKYDLVFTGNMNYPPNVKSAEYLVKEILPLLRKERKDIRLLIAGATPHENVRRLASHAVTVSGWMEDIRDAYASAKVFIAPMQIGTGLQNKLLEAMAMKIPCVTSELANNALNAKEQKEVMVGSTPKEYAEHVLRLLDDEAFASQLSEEAFAFVRKNYSWYESSKVLSNLFQN